MTITAHVYQRRDQLWEWRLQAENGQIIATSGSQGYTRREDAVKAYERVKTLLRQAKLVTEDNDNGDTA